MSTLHPSHVDDSDHTPGGSGDPDPARPLEAGAVGVTETLQLPGSSGKTTSSAGLMEAAAIYHLDTTAENPTNLNRFARYLVITHYEKDKDITLVDPYAMQKALESLIGDGFKCTRFEKSKEVEIFVKTRRASDTLLKITEINCTEFVIPVTVTKHKSKNTCKGVIRCKSIRDTPRSKLLLNMAKHNVVEIYRLTRTVNGVQQKLDTYVLTFDLETRPHKIDMGFGELVKVTTYYQNPILCRNCQRYGHGAKTCNNKQRCAKCGDEGHSFADCDKVASCHYCKSDLQGCIVESSCM